MNMDTIPTSDDLRMAAELVAAEPFSGAIPRYPHLRAHRGYDGSTYYMSNMKIHADRRADDYHDWTMVSEGDVDALRDAYAELLPQIRAVNAGWSRAGKLDRVFVASAVSSVTQESYRREHLVAYFRTAEDRDAFVAANSHAHGRWYGFAPGEYSAHEIPSALVPPVGQWQRATSMVI